MHQSTSLEVTISNPELHIINLLQYVWQRLQVFFLAQALFSEL